jgi:hypothetical protein
MVYTALDRDRCDELDGGGSVPPPWEDAGYAPGRRAAASAMMWPDHGEVSRGKSLGLSPMNSRGPGPLGLRDFNPDLVFNPPMRPRLADLLV